MARLTKQQKREKRARQEREGQRSEQVRDQMTAEFVCPTGVCRQFADQCADRSLDLEVDIALSQVAVEVWASPKDDLRPVTDLMRELLEERQRHHAALAALSARLREFQAKNLHDHLEPRDHYRNFIETRMMELTAAARASAHAPPGDLEDGDGFDELE